MQHIIADLFHDILEILMKKAIIQIDNNSINQAVENSSKIEGMSFLRAKKNTFAIKLLKQHGRAFSL